MKVTPQSFIIRIDGVAFHTFTKGLNSPMDSRLTRCMIQTTIDLVEKFQAVTGYHQSDEISLVFPAANTLAQVTEALAASTAVPAPKNKKRKIALKTHCYNGRVQKLASVTASYASARLCYHLMQEDWSDLDEVVQKRMVDHTAYFDGRLVACTSTKHLTDCIFWRYLFTS